MNANPLFLKALEDLRAGQKEGLRPIPVHVSMGLGELARRQALSGDVPKDMEAMMAGIRAYQMHPFRREMTPPDVVWSQGQARLFLYPAQGVKKAAKGHIFVVPSMIACTSFCAL